MSAISIATAIPRFLAFVLGRSVMAFLGIKEYVTDADAENTELVKFIGTARESVKAVIGEGRAYEVQEAVLKKVIESNSGTPVEFIVGPQYKNHARLRYFIERIGAQVYVLPYEPLQHYAIVDGYKVRVEAPHSVEKKRKEYHTQMVSVVKRLEKQFADDKLNAVPAEVRIASK